MEAALPIHFSCTGPLPAPRRAKYESAEAKRQLCNSYDLFVADDRILPSLPKLIGAHTWRRSGGAGALSTG